MFSKLNNVIDCTTCIEDAPLDVSNLIKYIKSVFYKTPALRLLAALTPHIQIIQLDCVKSLVGTGEDEEKLLAATILQAKQMKVKKLEGLISIAVAVLERPDTSMKMKSSALQFLVQNPKKYRLSSTSVDILIKLASTTPKSLYQKKAVGYACTIIRDVMVDPLLPVPNKKGMLVHTSSIPPF